MYKIILEFFNKNSTPNGVLFLLYVMCEEEFDMNTKTWVITVGGVVCAPLLLGDADSKSTENAIETDEKSL